jgi:hypothetical protein
MTYELDDLPQGHQFFPGIRVLSISFDGVPSELDTEDNEWPGVTDPAEVFQELLLILMLKN